MGEEFVNLCTPHLWAIFLTIGVMVLLFGSGQLLKPWISALIKRLSGGETEVNVNIGPNGMAQEMTRHSDEMGEIMAKDKLSCVGCPGLIDPTKCPMHEAERERSLRNEKSIKELWEHFGNLQSELKREISDIKELAAANNAAIVNNQRTILDAINKITPRRPK